MKRATGERRSFARTGGLETVTGPDRMSDELMAEGPTPESLATQAQTTKETTKETKKEICALAFYTSSTSNRSRPDVINEN